MTRQFILWYRYYSLIGTYITVMSQLVSNAGSVRPFSSFCALRNMLIAKHHLLRRTELGIAFAGVR